MISIMIENFACLEFHINRSEWYHPFCVWFLSSHIMILRFIYLVCSRGPFFCIAEQGFIVYPKGLISCLPLIIFYDTLVCTHSSPAMLIFGPLNKLLLNLQGLCIGCFLCIECSSLILGMASFFSFQGSAKISPSQRGFLWLASITHLHVSFLCCPFFLV